MSQKIAVAIIHGIGVPDPHFADGMIEELRERISEHLSAYTANPASEIVFKPVLWAPVLQGRENILWEKVKSSGTVDFVKLRRFMIDFAADALAYQPTPHDQGAYQGVHRLVAEVFQALAAEAGPNAPLAIISHSLGTVIASNYIYDLQTNPKRRIITPAVRRAMGKTPLDKGETFAGLYTLGSPLALWSMRYDDFGVPISVPSPKLARFYPKLKGEWLNFYDPSDVIGYPLRGLNNAYARMVTADRSVNVGNILTSWNPASHVEYWTDNDVTIPIAESLARLWRQTNP